MRVRELIAELQNLTDEQKEQFIYGFDDGDLYSINSIDDSVSDRIDINLNRSRRM